MARARKSVVLPSAPNDPAQVRRDARSGPAAVMRAEWVDPDDVRPSAARTAKQVRGWRTFCPLRKMLVNGSSGVTHQHILAADKLRELCDIARLGHSAGLSLVFFVRSSQPSMGPGPAELRRVAAWRALVRAMAAFTPGQIAMLEAVVLANMTLYAWAHARGLKVEVERGRLLAILEQLAQQFAPEVGQEVARGSRLAP